MKNNIIIASLILLSFSFGYTLSGFLIYRSLIGNMSQAIDIPDMRVAKHDSKN